MVCCSCCVVLLAVALAVAYVCKQLMAKKGNAVKFQWKFTLYHFLMLFVTGLYVPFLLIKGKSVKNCLYMAPVMKHIASLIGLKFELRRGHVLAEDKGFVIVANHQATIDALGMFSIWNVIDKCAIIAKKELFYLWPFGLAAYLVGMVFINRSDPKTAYKQLEVTSELMVKEKTKIWVFPEGTRNLRGGMLSFRRGAFKMAVAAQTPIVPLVYSPYYFINREKQYFGPGRIIITALDPIETKGLTDDDIPKLMEKTRDLMLEMYNQVGKELSGLPLDYSD